MANRILTGVKISGNLELDAAIVDGSQSLGTSGQLLSSTGTGVQWVDASAGGGGVPYTGATGNLDLGTYGLIGDFVQFNTTPDNIPTATGTLYYDEENETLSLNGIGGVVQQIGQEIFYPKCTNNTGSTIYNGTLVMVNPSTPVQGGKLNIQPAITDSTYSADLVLGIATQDISTNNNGMVTWFGYVRDVTITNINLNSETWAVGNILYGDPSNNGGLTNVEPAAPNHKSKIAIITAIDATYVTLMVRPSVGEHLYELHDVNISSVSGNQAILWNSTNSRWQNTTLNTSFITESGNLYYTDARARAAISETVNGLSYNSSTGVLSLTTGYVIPTTTEQSNWTTAYNWGNHANAGYLTSYTETDPIFVAHAAYGITSTKITNWDTAYGWGNHASAGYFTTSNDGAGSGLDADLLDGNHASAFALASHTHNYDNYGSWTLYTDGTSRGGITSGEVVNFVGGSNVTLSYSATNNTVTINSTDTNTVYTHPTYTARSINTSGASVLDVFTSDTSGHVTNITTRTLTLADLGYTGATNANYITNNNQLTNGAGYVTSSGSVNYATSAGNADTVDSLHASSFIRNDTDNAVSNTAVEVSFYSNDLGESTAGDQATLEVYQDTAGADAFMQFHISGDFAAYFGLAGDWNDFFVGGWSMGANRYRIWHQGNDGSGSGLDADLLDGNHASAFYLATNPNGYISSYTETDTLATVTSRGSSTTGAITVNGDLTVGSGTYSYINMVDSDEGNRSIHCNSNRIGFLKQDGSWGSYLDDGGNFYGVDSLRAPIFYDTNNTGYYVDPSNVSNILYLTVNGYITSNASSTRDKIRVWSSGTYAMGMGSGYTYGALNDYAATFQMSDSTDRGWWWGHSGHTNAQGAMSVTTDGQLTVAATISVGYGESTTADASYTLDVNGDVYASSSSRAPIFYDSNNTAYYVDPNGTSRMDRIDPNEIYNYGWFRNHQVNEGMYNQATGTHFYSDGTGYWNATGNGDTQVTGIKFRGTHQGTIRGYIYNDGAGNFGLLSADGSWAVRTSNSNLEFYHVTYATDIRSYIFYDRNNTGYYVDPASTSNLNALTCVSLTETSSLRYKENIVDLHNSLDKVLNMRGVAYNRKGSKDVELGVIAEEVAEIVPEIVNFTKSGDADSVSYGRITALLIESIKEQQKQIDKLKELLNNK